MELPLSGPTIMDGATGTELQKRGMPQGACTEAWCLEHPEVLLDLQRAYVAAGSGLLLTPTACANRVTLEQFGLAERVEDVNRRLAALTRQAAEDGVLVAGGLGPVMGELPFETLVEVYAQQAAALDSAGVDLFVAESLLTMAQVRAALLAVGKLGKPAIISCYCDDEGRTPSGTDVLAAGIVAQGMGAAAFGVNCVLPQTARAQVERCAPYLTIPLLVKPAGNLGDGDLAGHVPAWAAAGVRLFGGCCGTGPEDVAALKTAVAGVDFAALPVLERDPDVIPCASGTEARFITPDVDTAALECSPDLLEDIVEAEEDMPAGALKISIWEEDDLDIFAENQYAIRDALCLESDVPELMEAALRAYQGRAFYDGTSDLEPAVLARLSREYGLIVL